MTALDIGAYVLRLEVSSTSGEVVHEFLPVSLERNLPYPISSHGPDAIAPDVSGDLVVWEQASGDPATGSDVFAKDLRREREIAISERPGDQKLPRVSGRRISFLDRERFPGGEIGTCRLDAKAGRCDPILVATGPERRNTPVPSGDLIFWLEEAVGSSGPRVCDLRGGATACTPRPVATRPVRQFDLDVSGLRLVWRELLPSQGLWSCVLDPASDACPPQLVNGGASVGFAPSVSGTLFAWERFVTTPGQGIGEEVAICRLDPATGACPAQPVGAPTTGSPGADVSGNVVVWSAATGDEASAIYFCERDALSGSCPAQRVTGAAAGQQHPAISGRRIVFEDSRDGPPRIYGFDLPELLVHGARRVREGSWLQIAVLGRDPTGGPMALAAELPGGVPVQSLGMRFHQLGKGPGLLSWRPRRGAAGTYTVLLRGTTQGRLVTRESVQIEVVESSRRDRFQHEDGSGDE